jgi:hypothetical protein
VDSDRDADRDANVTDAVHVRKRNRVRHGEDVAEEEQTRVRQRGRVQEIARAREPSGGAQGTPRRRHDAVVRKDRDQVQRRAEREQSHSGEASVRDHEDRRQGVRPDVEDPMEPRAPAREHGDDRELECEGAEDRRRVPEAHPAEGREAPAGGPHRDRCENDGGEQKHDLVSTRAVTPCCRNRPRTLKYGHPNAETWSLTARTAPKEGTNCK